MKKLLAPIVFGFIAGAIVSFLVTRSIYRQPEKLISPLPDDCNCVEFNIELKGVNPSKELEYEKQSTDSAKPIRGIEKQPASTTELRGSDNNVVTASYYTTEYCERYNPSCLTASGQVFTNEGLTAACADRFKLGTKIRLTSDNGSVTVVCNDRGSFEESYGRTFDLTPTAFSKLAALSKGVVTVRYQVVD